LAEKIYNINFFCVVKTRRNKQPLQNNIYQELTNGQIPNGVDKFSEIC